MLVQRYWRIGGAVTVACAAAMALYSARTGLLRDSVAHLVATFSHEVERASIETSFAFCVFYWSVFATFFFLSLYAAFLDIRYLRLQYALGKQELLKQTLEDADFRQALIDGAKKK